MSWNTVSREMRCDVFGSSLFLPSALMGSSQTDQCPVTWTHTGSVPAFQNVWLEATDNRNREVYQFEHCQQNLVLHFIPLNISLKEFPNHYHPHGPNALFLYAFLKHKSKTLSTLFDFLIIHALILLNNFLSC